jgi:hypothetical protein
MLTALSPLWFVISQHTEDSFEKGFVRHLAIGA